MTRGLILLLLQLCNSSHNVLTPHISKTYLPIVSLNVCELKLNITQGKITVKGKGRLTLRGGGSPTPPENVNIY